MHTPKYSKQNPASVQSQHGRDKDASTVLRKKSNDLNDYKYIRAHTMYNTWCFPCLGVHSMRYIHRLWSVGSPRSRLPTGQHHTGERGGQTEGVLPHTGLGNIQTPEEVGLSEITPHTDNVQRYRAGLHDRGLHEGQ